MGISIMFLVASSFFIGTIVEKYFQEKELTFWDKIGFFLHPLCIFVSILNIIK